MNSNLFSSLTEPSVEIATSATADNVVVPPESGEDSEDEWNYINVKHEEEPNSNAAGQDALSQHTTASAATVSTPSGSEPTNDDHLQLDIAEPVAVDVDEDDLKPEASVEESHAVLQALVEPQEDYAELSAANQRDDDNSPIDRQTSEEHRCPSVVSDAEQQQELSTKADDIKLYDNVADVTDEEDMDFQLNPEAKEFVPTSPQRTPATSPFQQQHHGTNGNGIANPLLRTDLMIDDDCLIAQSPRKGGTPMDNIQVPSENDFDVDIANRPMELAAVDLLSPTAASAADAVSPVNGNNGSNTDRPGSSGSQYSYQELNLKEAMHGDEKLLEYAPEDALLSPLYGTAPVLAAAGSNGETIVNTDPLSSEEGLAADATATAEHANERFLRESDPMSMSFYNDGSAATGNPFAVDMNAVQLLPQDDDDDEERPNETAETQQRQSPETEHAQKPFHFDGVEGQHFVIQDTEFGMNNGNGAQSPIVDAFAQHDEISKPEEDQFSPVTDAQLVDQFDAFSDSKHSASFEEDVSNAISPVAERSAYESDRPEADLQQEQPIAVSSIVQLVQEMATEATSMLANVNLSDEGLEVDEANIVQFSSNTLSAFENSTPANDVSPAASPAELIGELTESDQNYSQIQSAVEAAAILVPESPKPVAETVENLMQQTLRPVVGDVIDVEPSESVAQTVHKTDTDVTGVVEAAAERLLVSGSAAIHQNETAPIVDETVAAVKADAAADSAIANEKKAASGATKKSPLKSTTTSSTLAAKKTTEVAAKARAAPAAKKPTTTTTTAATARGLTATAKTSAPSSAALNSARSGASTASASTSSAAQRPKPITARSTAATTAASTASATAAPARKPLTNGAATKSASTLLSAAKKPPTLVTKAASATTGAGVAARTSTAAAAKPTLSARTTATTARPASTTSSRTSTATTSATNTKSTSSSTTTVIKTSTTTR